ncbi:hypothetical protein ACFQ6N_30985 [Kitasatospora sp. NPDC056446]|uniref:hypothetical protein n=1 Tax=Kitasatospora sp. NPDC056446 TaxID=3345819 RepID=UPI0036C5F3A6
MKNLWVAAATACVLAGTLAGTASAAPAHTHTEPVAAHTLPAPSDGKGVVPSDPEVRPLTCEKKDVIVSEAGPGDKYRT